MALMRACGVRCRHREARRPCSGITAPRIDPRPLSSRHPHACRFPAGARMHVLAYVYGLAYYGVLAVTFLPPRLLRAALTLLLSRGSTPVDTTSVSLSAAECGAAGPPGDTGGSAEATRGGCGAPGGSGVGIAEVGDVAGAVAEAAVAALAADRMLLLVWASSCHCLANAAFTAAPVPRYVSCVRVCRRMNQSPACHDMGVFDGIHATLRTAACMTAISASRRKGLQTTWADLRCDLRCV